MGFLSGDDDEFSKVLSRVCAACGQPAACHRITTFNGLAKTYQFRCTACQRQFAVSSVFSLVLFIVVGLFMLTLSPLILTQEDGDVRFALGVAVVAVGFVAFAGYRIRTARKNPKIVAPNKSAVASTRPD